MGFRKILGSSPAVYTIKKISSCLFVHGGETADDYLTDKEFFEMIGPDIPPYKQKRLSNGELKKLLGTRAKLTKNQKLVKSVLEEAELSRMISESDFANVEQIYQLRRKYKTYIRAKRLIPLCVIAPFTSSELSKMAYAAAIGSKSVRLTLPGLIGYSLPGFFFFHMSSYYVPDKLKAFCQVGKYTIGAPFWIMGHITDELMSAPEERFFGEEVPLDVATTGGTIPSDIGEVQNLRKLLEEARGITEEFTKKTY